MARVWLTLSAFLAVLFAAYYQISLKAVLSVNGIWRSIESVGNTGCKMVESLQACESACAETRIICTNSLTCRDGVASSERSSLSRLLVTCRPPPLDSGLSASGRGQSCIRRLHRYVRCSNGLCHTSCFRGFPYFPRVFIPRHGCCPFGVEPRRTLRIRHQSPEASSGNRQGGWRELCC